MALLIVLANQIAGISNVDIMIYNDQFTAISESILSILGLLGIVIARQQKGFQIAYKQLIMTSQRTVNSNGCNS